MFKYLSRKPNSSFNSLPSPQKTLKRINIIMKMLNLCSYKCMIRGGNAGP